MLFGGMADPSLPRCMLWCLDVTVLCEWEEILALNKPFI